MNRPPLVAQVCASVPPRVCGIADYTHSLATALRTEGRAKGGLWVETWTGIGEAEESEKVHAVAPSWNGAGVRALAASLIAAKPWLVHLQYERAIYDDQAAICTLLPRLMRRARIPLVTTFHALDGPHSWGKSHRWALVPLLLGSKSIVVCSQRQLNALASLPIVGRRVRLIPVGSVIPVVHPRPEGRVRPSNSPLRLVYFGFVWRGRNLEVCVQSLQAILATGRAATLEIIGEIRDSAYAAELQTLAETLQIPAARIQFRGMLPAEMVSEELAAADLVMLPYATGVSMGRTTLMAALEHHAPTVTMGTPENQSPLFRDGENLRIVPAGDANAFVAAVTALASDEAARFRMSQGAAKLAQAFSWPTIARQTLALPAYEAVRLRL